MNRIEPSKSSRATCRTCKTKIDKGVARLGVETEFNMGGETVTSLKWHHLSCGMDKMPDAVLTAEIIPEVTSRGKPLRITDEDLERIEEFKEKYNKSGMAVIGLSEIDEPDKTVNLRAIILRAMAASTRENPEGDEEWGRTVYVIDDGYRSRLNLWGEHANVELQRDDEIVVLQAHSYLGGNDKIQFHVYEDAELLVNPSEEDIEEHSEGIELYISDAWKRPTGEPAEFTIAPSGRASCGVCEKKIAKGDLKVVKPGYIEIDRGDRKMTVSGARSFHPACVIDDEHGMEVLHEACSRLTLDQLSDHHEALDHLYQQLPKSAAKEILKSLL